MDANDYLHCNPPGNSENERFANAHNLAQQDQARARISASANSAGQSFSGGGAAGGATVGGPATRGGALIILSFPILVVLLSIFGWLDSRGYLTDSGLTWLPFVQRDSVKAYRAMDVNLASIFRSAPLILEGNVIIDGDLWHADIQTIRKANITVRGNISHSKILLANGSLQVANADHSILGAEHLTTTGHISSTVERGDYIANKGTLGQGNDILAQPRSFAKRR